MIAPEEGDLEQQKWDKSMKHDTTVTKQGELRLRQIEWDTSIGKFRQGVNHTSYQEQELTTKMAQ